MNYTMDHSPDALSHWANLICNPRHERTEREIVQLTEDDRDRLYADLGGAQDINPEEPDFVSRCLVELNESICKIPQKNAFSKAQRQSPHYTNNPAFRIMFLRADDFNIEKASRRIVMHFEEKMELFGPDKLVQRITLVDLNADDLECLIAGGIQWLPKPDNFGRTVLCSRQVFWNYKNRENLRRSLWYLVMTLMEDETVQRRGTVAIGYSIGNFHRGAVDLEMHRQFIKTGISLPFRLSAVYMCYTNPRFSSIVDSVTHFFSSFLRVRFRTIQGTRQEVNYQLMVMGIDPNTIPSGEDGGLRVENHIAWLRLRQELDFGRDVATQQAMENFTNGRTSGDSGDSMDASWVK